MSGLPRSRRKIRHQIAGSQALAESKPVALCQCYDSNIKQGCTREVARGSLYCNVHQNCPASPLNGSEPNYAPEKYNGDVSIYKSHNCYAYSMDVIDPKLVNQCKRNTKKNSCRQNFHQPGALHGDRFTLNTEERRTCPVVEKLMVSDVPEITKASFYQKCPKKMSKIALVVDPGEDYHYYRQDSDGLWSHKDGSNKVKRYDALKKNIINPKLASRDYRPQGSDLNYEDFCGFYCVPRYDKIHLGQGGSKKVSKKKARAQAKTRKMIQNWISGK